MIIANETDLAGMKKVSDAVALTLKEMREYACVGMSTKELDNYGGGLLDKFGAKSAPFSTYQFPGYTCISLNNEVCHGIPSADRIIQEGDLLNIDVSAELEGFWSDNGGSFIIGQDIHQQTKLIETSREILKKAINAIRGGFKINELGWLIESEAKKQGFKVIKNLGGHGIGRALHERPDAILNHQDRLDQRRFRKNTVVAIETFITTDSTWAVELPDGFTLVGDKGGFSVQHEHTIVVTDGLPIILTEQNGIWD
ncbi:type I methionyl aminopeptidase [Mucilaginibacter paludis]|uniref:Methionine aminopeptidase n=1 Tax=Mucilaginibacter paludis DSM 18603 TaxID=714943 RepID=H1Y352_9SPHI|nr:type I methionyl aminopeptidase [Mucilaginibacter paludis]EHQ28870.1 methionine aminopeptidase, type I [Mucilaginibacter paludis DSM 18603]